jgi:hypothetical protein
MLSTNFSISTQEPTFFQKDTSVLDPDCKCFLATCKICQARLFQPISQTTPFSTLDTPHQNRFSKSLPILPIIPEGYELFYRTPSKGYHDENFIFFHEIPEIRPINTPNQEITNQTHIILDNNCGENLVEGSNFRFANQKALFTYKSHLPKHEFKTWFNNNCGGTKIIEIAHEVGKTGGVDYDHSHVLVDFGRNFQTTNVRKFDYLHNNVIIHPHIKKIKNKTHWDRCCNYLAKEDPDNAHLKTEISIVKAVFNAENITDALINNVKRPSDVSGINQLWNMRPRDKLVIPKPDRPWSLQLMAYLETNQPDDRHIIWVYDEDGSGGKSRLVKYLWNEFPDKYRFSRGNSIRDASTDVLNAIDSGWNQHCFFFDFPRDMEGKKFYEPLENIKDGMMSVSKYNSRALGFKSPHVVVLANFPPEIHRLSKDRWWIFEITPAFNWRRVPEIEYRQMYKKHLDALERKKREAGMYEKSGPTDTLLTILN